MRHQKRLAILSGALVLGVGTAIGAAAQTAGSPAQVADQPAAAQTHAAKQHAFRGVVTRANVRHHWFGMRTASGRRLRIHTVSGTDWQNCDWAEMDAGHHIAIRAFRHDGAWIATMVRATAQGGHHHDGGDHME